MRYIISESRLEQLISKYLDSLLGSIEESFDEINGEVYHWWGTGLSPIFGLVETDEGIGIGFDDNFILRLTEMFGIPVDMAKSYLVDWIKKNLEIFPDFEFEPQSF